MIELIDKVVGQAVRAGDVVAHMRTMAQRHELEPNAIDVGRTIMECVSIVKMDCEMREIKVRLSVASALPFVTADEIHLQQVALNLLRNAMEAIEMFESFYSTKSSGLGVGLAICRKLIEAHGGKLWASHRPGGGALFRFTLPTEALAGTGQDSGRRLGRCHGCRSAALDKNHIRIQGHQFGGCSLEARRTARRSRLDQKIRLLCQRQSLQFIHEWLRDPNLWFTEP